MSGFLLDTNIPSEVGRSRPNPRVTPWVNGQDNRTLFLSAVSIGELRRGFALLPLGEHRTRPEQWFETDVLLWFGERILPVTKEIADRWGTLDANCQLRGTPANTADGMIAVNACSVLRSRRTVTRIWCTASGLSRRTSRSSALSRVAWASR